MSENLTPANFVCQDCGAVNKDSAPFNVERNGWNLGRITLQCQCWNCGRRYDAVIETGFRMGEIV